jgi:hypothetical protein
MDARVRQRLVERLVRIGQVDVLADHADRDFVLGMIERVEHALPLGQIGRRQRIEQPQTLEHDVVETLALEDLRNAVDLIDVDRRNHRLFLDIGEQRDLAPLLVGQRRRCAAQQHVRLDADRAQLLDRVLRRLRLHLARGLDVRHQRQVHEHRVLAPDLDAELADRLQERQRLDVADRAADLDHADVGVAGTLVDQALDLVGDVRNHLHGAAEVIAAALLRDHVLVDAAGGEVAALARACAGEALVVAEIEIGLGAVVRHEHFPVLIRAHRPGIDVDIRIELEHRDLEATRFKQRAEGGRRDALAERGHHATGYEYETGHGLGRLGRSAASKGEG